MAEQPTMDWTELFVPAAMAAYYEEVYSNQIPYLGRGLFPARKVAGLEISWIRGSKGLPVSLMPSAFDAKATFRTRQGFEQLKTEMPFFREGYNFKEIDRQKILNAQATNDPYVNDIISRIYDDVADLVAGAAVVPERMIFQLMFPEGDDIGITIKANGVNYTYNYDPDGTWKKNNKITLTTTDLWTAAETADPFKNFDEVKNKALEKNGTVLTRAVMNSTTYNYLAKMDAVKSRFLTLNGAAIGYLRSGDVNNVLRDATGIIPVIYDKKYKAENGETHKFVPDNYVAVIPDGALGETCYGTTPEEADLRGASSAEVSIVDTGVAITRILNPHPVNISTFASEIVLPTFTAMDDCYLLKVAG